MIVVVAEDADDEAASLVSRWTAADAVRLTPIDLSTPGWSALFPQAGPSFVAGGERHPTAEISGVLVRLAAVSPQHLPHFAAEDREYAAAEMTAFLAYWLNALQAPVVNRPSSPFLLGPAWTNEQWLVQASKDRIPVVTVMVSRGNSAVPQQTLEWISVAGGRAFPESAAGAESALKLAEHTGVPLLGAGFDLSDSVARLAAVTVRPAISAEIADVLLPMLVAA